MKLARIAGVAVLGSLGTACLSTEPIPTNDYGYISLVGEDSDAGAVIASPLAYFFRSQQLNFTPSGNAQDQCQKMPVPPDDLPTLNYLDAGQQVTVTVGGAEHVLPKVARPAGFVYSLEAPVSYEPGETVTVEIPGAEAAFPPVQFTAPTADSFSVSAPVPVPTDPTEGVALTWTAGDPAASSMTVALRYIPSSGTAAEQVYCVLRDDGSFTIPPLFVDAWKAENTGSRTALFERVLVTIHRDPATDVVVDFVSSWLEEAEVQQPVVQ